MSPLMLATMLGWRNETVLLALLDHKANVDATTEFGFLALMAILRARWPYDALCK